jgi:HK97 family phage prohead protease
MRLLGYPIVFGAAYNPAPDVEEVIAPCVLERALREHENIKLLVNHDAKKQVASLDDGTLRLQVEPHGVRAEFDVPDSPAGRELKAALDAGAICGGSFGWTPLKNRWLLNRSPIRVEVRDAIVHEVSIILAPKRPRYRDTWAAALGPGLAARYRQLDLQRARFGPPSRAAEPAADLVLTLRRPSYGWFEPLMRLFVDQMAPEWKEVQAAARQHPHAKIIDVVYRRSLKSYQEVMRRRFPQPADELQSVGASPANSRPRSQAPQGVMPMPQPNEHEWERRPAPGSALARTEDFAPALRSLERHKREHEARQRRRGRLTVSEAQIRGRASMGSR